MTTTYAPSRYGFPLPPPPPEELREHIVAIEHWLQVEQGANEYQTSLVLGLFEEDYLRRLPRFVRVRWAQIYNTNRGLCYSFQSWTANILGWEERRGEGREDGFPEWLNELLRGHI